MSPSQAAFLVLAFLGVCGACYWTGVAIHWLYKLMTTPEILPPPVPDERDTMAEWRRLMDEIS